MEGSKANYRELRSFSCLSWSAIDFHQTNKNLTRTLHAKARHHEMFVSVLHTLGLSLDDWNAEHWLCATRKVIQITATCLHDLLFPVNKLAATMTAR